MLASERRRGIRLDRLVRRLAAYRQAPGAPPDHQLDELDERVLAALWRLRPRDREALLLVTWEQLSNAEAAAVLGCSSNAVAIRVHRSKRLLRLLLTAGGDAGHTTSTPALGAHHGP